MTCVHIDHSMRMRVIDAYARASGVVNADSESATHVREHAQRWFCTTCGLSFTSARDVASHSKSTDGVHVVYVKTRCRKPFSIVCEACAVIDEARVGEDAAYAASAGGETDARDVGDRDDLDLQKRLADRERYLEQFTCASSSPAVKKTKRTLPPRGLRGNVNMGNTCFMASTLQALMATPSFASYFLAEKHREMNCKVRDCVACALDHYVERAFSQDEFLIPADLLYTWWKNDLSFARHAQQDAHEFFLMFLELVHANIKGRSSRSKPPTLGAETQKEQRLLKILSLEHGENATDVHHDEDGEDGEDDCKNISKCQCVVHSAFAGVTQSDLLCNGCGAVTSSTLEDMLGLSLDVPFARTTPAVKLLECLSAFSRVENMDTSGFSRRICPKCSSPQDMQKQMSLKRTPRMLVLHLKRFAARGSDGYRQKDSSIEIAAEDVNVDSDTASDGDRAHATGFKSLVKTDVHVEFPFTLDVSPWCASTVAARRVLGNDDIALNAQRAHDVKYKYSLYAVIVHSGVLHGGHYTCYVKRNDDWFLCDDASVHRVDIDEVRSAQAYMLFYG